MRPKYNLGYLVLGISSLLFTLTPSAYAVTPASVNQDAGVAWSSIVENPFDGKIVYDKHFSDDFAFVTSWSKQGINATYTEYWSEVVGYRRVWKTRSVRRDDHYIDERYSDREAITEKRSRSRSPKSLQFSYQGKIYTYNSGAVDPELSAILANFPAGNTTIRAIWNNDQTSDFPIGSGTVEAWKTIFKTDSPPPRFGN
ncbi:hypothetical protein [Pseudanabaena sp. UWO310]|uniref:hypothetical protein n=1 Tax=Pseudanabaena sp. UWO310 TaxID=2480795 RepID=UPI0011612357|nr:hypothetical protein [Pseudanabaena sp. UWO310]TYQ23679.1 hypothetical protein PseudUWO310_21975 [Pseudanabaena sp. UWO310]